MRPCSLKPDTGVLVTMPLLVASRQSSFSASSLLSTTCTLTSVSPSASLQQMTPCAPRLSSRSSDSAMRLPTPWSVAMSSHGPLSFAASCMLLCDTVVAPTT